MSDAYREFSRHELKASGNSDGAGGYLSHKRAVLDHPNIWIRSVVPSRIRMIGACSAQRHITDRFLRSSDRHFFIEPSASICMRAILRCSVESDRMRSMTSFSSRILDRDFRPGAGPCTSASIGTSNASAIRIRVSSEGRAWARSRLLRLADVRLIRSAKFSWVKPLARRAARMAAAICSLRALSMPQVGLWKAEYHKVDFMFSLENKLNLNYTLKLSENL